MDRVNLFDRRMRQGRILIFVVFLCLGLFFFFFHKYFIDIDKYILSHDLDWEKELQYYGNIKQQIFQLCQFPHCSLHVHQNTYLLFANPETSVLTPVNLLLPLTSLYDFFIYHLSIHYFIALAGFLLLRKVLNLPVFSVVLMFVFLGFNGRIVSNYLVAHTMMITVMWMPLLLYFYISFSRGDPRRWFIHAAGFAFVLTMIFLEGGVHLVIWIFLFLVFDLMLFLIFEMIEKRGQARAGIALHFKFLIVGAFIFAGLGAVKILPVLIGFDVSYAPEPIAGYQSILFFLQTFYQYGLGPDIPYKELWMEEAYNFVGAAGFVFAVFALLYALFMHRDAMIRRFGLLALIFIVLSFGSLYAMLFGDIPVLRAERVASRFVFLSILLLTLLIPVTLHEFLTRINVRRKIQEFLMLLLGMFIYIQMYVEGRNWMFPINEPFELHIHIPLTCGMPEYYFFFFYAGIAISLLTFLSIAVFLIFSNKRKRLRG